MIVLNDTELAIQRREARAYAQALIDAAGGHAEELTAFAERWVAECVYCDDRHRELLAARLTAYAEGYGAGYTEGQAVGYQTGTEDGAMTAKRGGERE